MKEAPVLSGIFSSDGLKRLDQFMLQKGFSTKYKMTFKLPPTPPEGTPRRDVYLIRAYDVPAECEELSAAERRDLYMRLHLELRNIGVSRQDMMVFAFWPDTIVIKEIGDPTALADYLDLGRKELQARVILAQGRQNTSCTVNLCSCHPFFLQGFATMANGENTALGSNRRFLASRGFAGYNGHQSDSEIFTHALHYTMAQLDMDIGAFKHVITPLDDDQLKAHPDACFLTHLKRTCRQLIIDGPNCVVGCLPDNTLFMAQDRKKLRPGVAGGQPGKYAFASEVCGLDAVMPDRDHRRDFQPMHLDTVIVGPDRDSLAILRQSEPIFRN
jgi:glutamate synthase domain-containing protein 1